MSSSALSLLLCSVVLYMAGALLSLFFAKQERMAVYATGICGAIAGALGIIAAWPVLIGSEGVLVAVLFESVEFLSCQIRLDMLSAMMIAVISLLAIAASVYSLSYVQEYIGKGAWGIGFFMNTFIASMVILMVMDNAFYFIIFFEMMSLASYFLVISEQNEEAISAGLLYFFIAHAGSVLIMIAFFLMYRESGSLSFESFRQVAQAGQYSPWMASVIFLLAFFGFGAKAGMLPLHGWLPRAHPAAPSHASAMMSGVMVKIGVFGIIKVGVDLLGATEMWWGIVVLAFGAVSSVLGVMYALAEHDIKRLLAYHTVENIGIILIGTGVGMIGLSLKDATGATTQAGQILAALGFLGALYHLLNHAVFKGLLFLGAGAIIYRIHTKDMEEMGGLSRLMPLTAIAFLIGCMAISALPPLNGFVSEWYTYQALFSMSMERESFAMQLAGPVAVVMLAITGALAAMCFVKVYGVSFCGQARSDKALHAREVPLPMTLSMLVLAGLCVLLGIGAAYVAPIIAGVAGSLIPITSGAELVAVQGGVLVPHTAEQAVLSPALVMVLLLGAVMLPLIVYALTAGQRMPHRRRDDPWACGYDYELRMAQSAGSFTQSLRYMFAVLYTMRQTLNPGPWMRKALEMTTNGAKRIEPFWDEQLLARIVRSVQQVGRKAQVIQHGDFRVYCLYVVVALVVLLLLTLV